MDPNFPRIGFTRVIAGCIYFLLSERLLKGAFGNQIRVDDTI